MMSLTADSNCFSNAMVQIMMDVQFTSFISVGIQLIYSTEHLISQTVDASTQRFQKESTKVKAVHFL
jgi:hypothetical protein